MYSKHVMKKCSKVNEYGLTMYNNRHLYRLKRHFPCTKNQSKNTMWKIPEITIIMYSKHTMKIGSNVNEYVLTMYYSRDLYWLKGNFPCTKNHIRGMQCNYPEIVHNLKSKNIMRQIPEIASVLYSKHTIKVC